MSSLSVYISLFAVAFVSATVLPAQSEALLALLLNTEKYSIWLLITVASVGNVLGSVLNWMMGLQVQRFKNRKWFPCKPETLEKYQAWYQRYGRWCLLLSWVPVIGDPLTVVAGVMRERFWPFIILVTVAKTTRYAVLALFFIE